VGKALQSEFGVQIDHEAKTLQVVIVNATKCGFVVAFWLSSSRYSATSIMVRSMARKQKSHLAVAFCILNQ
jgi:hypothetical protein